MSFSQDVKNELCKNSLSKPCCVVAEAYGLLLYASVFSAKEIRITTSHPGLQQRIPQLFKRAFGISVEISRAGEQRVNFSAQDPEDIRRVFDAIGYEFKDVPLHLNNAVIENECCKNAFLRGVFLRGGSITGLEKKYHLEISTGHAALSREIMALLLDQGFQPKLLQRKNNYILYSKDSSFMEDFLTAIGAPLSAMHLMQEKIERELRNSVNRRVNCETANISKSINAAQRQLEAIRKLEARDKLVTLPEPLKETARLRLEHPDASLEELCKLHRESISKPGLSHRLSKLIALAAKQD